MKVTIENLNGRLRLRGTFPETGKRKNLVLNDDEVEVINIIRKHRRSGKSYQSIANYLNDNQVKSKRGG